MPRGRSGRGAAAPTCRALTAELVRQGIRAAGPHANDLHDRIVGQVERELIQQVLQTCDRVQIKAAARLGINRNTLHKKLAEFRIDDAGARRRPTARQRRRQSTTTRSTTPAARRRVRDPASPIDED